MADFVRQKSESQAPDPVLYLGCQQREGPVSERVFEGCAAVMKSAAIGRYYWSAMLNLSGLASPHNSIEDLEQGQ